MILPIIDYANFCLTPCTEKLKTKLQHLQNRALRICFKSIRYDNIHDLHVRACLASLEKRREVDLLKQFHRLVYSAGTKPFDLSINGLPVGKYNPHSPNPPLTITRSYLAPVAATAMPTSEKYKRSMLYKSATMWNNLDTDTRNIVDFESFKIKIKRQIYLPYLPTPNSGVVSPSNE